jgi:hypothetical protein
MSLRVEVFPIDMARWIAVIDAPDGPFSTEAGHPSAVPDAVAASIREVLGSEAADADLVDDLGDPWTTASADEQRRRLGIDGG